MSNSPLTSGVIALVLLACGCSRTSAPPPSILLVSLDTVRADRLGSYGHGGRLTPNLDALASASVLFEDVTASVPLTTPSHASILTGTLPQRHGIRNNEGFRLAEDVATLAEALRSSGYRTGAFVAAAPLSSRFGLARGFDVYDEDVSEERPAAEVLARARAFVASCRREGVPYFAFLHLFEAHSPYEPPPPFDARHAEDPYGGEIAFLDDALGRFFRFLRESGDWNEMLLSVVSDHGESLGEHGESTHGVLLHGATTRVPWILKLPRGRASGRRIPSAVRAIDVAPTILGSLGLAGLETADGVDLSGLLDDGDVPPLPVYSESLYLHLLLGWSDLRSLRVGELKLIDAPSPELYDLSEDPAETSNLFDARPREATRLLEALAPLRDDPPASTSPDPVVHRRLSALGYLSGSTLAEERSAIDPKKAMPIWREIEAAASLLDREPLRARRHLERALELDPGNGLAQKLLADLALGAGDVRGAARWLEASRSAGFRHPDADVTALRIDLAEGRFESARAALSERLRVDPDDAALLGLLGESLRGLGRLVEAEEALRRALLLRPGDVRLHNELGVVLASTERAGDARRAFRRAVELDPVAPEPLTNLARLSEGEESITLLERAVRSRPDHVPARVELAKRLAAKGELAAAARHAEAALEHGPREPESVFVAARVADLMGDAEVAAERYRRFLDLAPAELGEAASMARERLKATASGSRR